MASSTTADQQLKQRHRAMWALGDYPSMVTDFLTPLGEQLVEAAASSPASACSTWPPAPGTPRSPLPSAARASSPPT